MKIALPCRAAVGPARVIAAAFAAIMLAALAQPVAASPLSAQSNAPYEGHDVNITFANAWPQNLHIRYKWKTADGSATGSGRWKDYEPASGYVTWSPVAVSAQEAVTVETVQDQLCEYDETFKIILYELESSLNWYVSGWSGYCGNNRGLPCGFEAEVTIKQHEDGCTAGTFGE